MSQDATSFLEDPAQVAAGQASDTGQFLGLFIERPAVRWIRSPRSDSDLPNLNFSEWPSIFPNATCTIALIDRIIHHADIIAIVNSRKSG